MNKIKKSCLFRTISLVLILTFISLDISYAYPPEYNVSNSTLATPSVLQQTPINDHAARFQQSVFSQSALIASVYDIGEYFFGNADKGVEPLPSKYAEDAMRADLGKHLSDVGTEILNIVPVEYIKKAAPDKLKSALDEIGFKGTLPDEGVVFILYKKGDKKFLVQIAMKDHVSSDSLPGYEWVVSDKYVVKYMPQDYKVTVAQVVQVPKHLEDITTAVTQELAQRKEMTAQVLFTLVQSKVPESMQNLRNALAELSSLSEQSNVTADAIYSAITQVEKKYKLSDEETKILWLALTGPGQGMGENGIYIPRSADEAYDAVIATLLKIRNDIKYYIFEPKIDKDKVREALKTGKDTYIGTVYWGYDTGNYSDDESVAVDFSKGVIVFHKDYYGKYDDGPNKYKLEKPANSSLSITTPEEKPQPKPDTVQKVTQLFEIVESSLNNERAKFIESWNKVINLLVTKAASGSAVDVGIIDKKMATAEIRQRLEHAISVIEGLEKEKISSETRASIELLKKNLTQFEADGAAGSLIVLARKAKRENQKLIIGLETDWIPGINVENSLQRQAITALMKEINGIAEALQSMGLDNVEVIRGSGSQLAGAILNEAEKTHTKMHNIVVMASANTINSNSFAVLRNADENDRPFLTGIDPTELIKLYTQFGEAVSKQLYIRLASLLYMTLELAAGKEPPQSPIIVSYDKKLRILILLPKADPIDYEALKSNYASEKAALQAA
ncbi:MAG: hypothetical protein A3C51_04630 [Omnitrophica bacterium RIFCSPHIGHO2_02_FULL_46_20]|nr:MAG: hypothetical protein A3C51_04630 [Omnitrophica bacterium RIFCSPHIGHO2_02_FULL_46_20]